MADTSSLSVYKHVPPNTDNFYSPEEFLVKNPFTRKYEFRRAEDFRQDRVMEGEKLGLPVIFVDSPHKRKCCLYVPCFSIGKMDQYEDGPPTVLPIGVFKKAFGKKVDYKNATSSVKYKGKRYIRLYDIDFESRIKPSLTEALILPTESPPPPPSSKGVKRKWEFDQTDGENKENGGASGLSEKVQKVDSISTTQIFDWSDGAIGQFNTTLLSEGKTWTR